MRYLFFQQLTLHYPALSFFLTPIYPAFRRIAIGIFVVTTLNVGCFELVAERQLIKYRRAYFHAVLRQDLGSRSGGQTRFPPPEKNELVLSI